jgi:hypothetical protein
MTEDEAKAKACFRAATFGASQQLADGPGPHCIGSACGAWRTTQGALRLLELQARVNNPEALYHVQRAILDSPNGGYCGLAGPLA